MASAEEAIKLKVQILLEQELKNLDKAMQGASAGIQKTLNKALKDSEKSSKNVGKSFEDNAQAARDIEMGLRGASKESANISKGLSGLASSGMAVQKAFSFSKGQIAGIFGIAGLSGMISGTRAWRSELLGLNEEFAGMSNSLGSTGKAMGVYWSVLGKTGATAGTVKASMKTLDEQGLKPASEGFERLTLLGANLQQSTGVAADTWGQLNGKLSFNWKAPIASIEKINSVLISSGLSASQMTQVINGMNGSLENLNGFAKDGAKSAVALAAGYVGATKAMTQMGISTQKATQFMDKLLDPEHIQDNLLLLSKAGISYYDFTQMLTSEGGKQNFFDKLGQGLPRLAQQLEQIRDPITRMQQAKALGLPIEIAQKLAAAGPGQMQSVMRQAMNDAKNKEALEKKQQQAKDAAAKLDERLHLIRMQLFSKLLPIFESALPKAMNLLNQLFQRGGQLFGFIGERLNVVFQNLAPAFDAMLKGDWDKVPEKLGEGFKKITTDAITVLAKTIVPLAKQVWNNVLPAAISSGWKILKGIFEASPLLGIVAGIYAGTKVFGPAIQLAWAIKTWARDTKWQQQMLAAIMKKTPGDGSSGGAGGVFDMLFGKDTKARKGLVWTGEKISSIGASTSSAIAGSRTGQFLGKVGGKIGQGAKAVGNFVKRIPLAGVAMTGIDVAQAAMSGKAEDVGGAVGGAIGMGIGGMLAGPVGAMIGNYIGGKIGEHIVTTWKQTKEDKEKGFFDSAEQEKKAGMTTKDYQNLTGIDHPFFSSKEDMRGLSAQMFRELEEKSMGKGLSNDKAAMYRKGDVTIASSKSEEKAFVDIAKKREESYQNELKYAQETLKTSKHLLSEKRRLELEGIVAFDKKRQSADSLIQLQQLELKKQLSDDLTDEEKEKYKELKQIASLNNAEIITKTGQSATLWRASYGKVTKEMVTGMKVAMEKLGDVVQGGVEALQLGLLQANSSIASFGTNWFGVDSTWFGGDGDKQKLRKTLEATGVEFMNSFAPALEGKSAKQQAAFFEARAKELETGGLTGSEYFKKAFIKNQGDMSVLEANKDKDAIKKWRNDIVDSLKQQANLTKARAKREAKHAATMAGFGKEIAENTAPKVERASTDKWIDFLRSSGMIEAGVVY